MKINWDRWAISVIPASIISLFFTMMNILPFYGLLTFFLIMSLSMYGIMYKLEMWAEEQDPIEEIKEQYRESEMSEEDLERQLERELE